MATKGKKKGERKARTTGASVRKATTTRKRAVEDTSMVGLVSEPLTISAVFKKELYSAVLRADGTIETDGQSFSSFSAAAKHVTGGKSINGWTFWKYSDGKEDKAVNALRKKAA